MKDMFKAILFPSQLTVIFRLLFHLSQCVAGLIVGYLNFVMSPSRSLSGSLTGCLSAVLSPATLICISNHFVLTNSRRFSFETMNPTPTRTTRTTRVIVLRPDNKSQEIQTKRGRENEESEWAGELDGWRVKERNLATVKQKRTWRKAA